MKGFDPKFRDFPDYILGITHEIWEGRGIATLRDYYAQDIIVRSPGSVVRGNGGVIAATMATLAEFPDRQLLGEDVIWSGTPETGMLSSHRIVSTATHAGDGVYGKATEYARDLIAREGGPEACVKPCGPANDIAGPYQGRGNDDPWGARLGEMLTRIMGADMAVIAADYDRAAHLEYPGHVTAHGPAAATNLWMGLRAAFPSARFAIHHQIGRTDPDMPPRAAIRWSLTGKHDGWGAFGRPTGADVHVMGITHGEYGRHGNAPAQLRREWTLFDETAIWKQIHLATGAA